jgi:hypothetical protein
MNNPPNHVREGRNKALWTLKAKAMEIDGAPLTYHIHSSVMHPKPLTCQVQYPKLNYNEN